MTVLDRRVCGGGTLSSSDIAGRLLPVVPAGMPFPVGPVDPAGSAGPYVAGAQLAQLGRCPPFSLTQLTRLAVLVALLARMGCCPHLTLTLLGQLALQVALLARVGRCPRLNVIMLAQMTCVFQMVQWARWDIVPVTLVGFFLCLTLHLGVRYLQVWKDSRRVRMGWGPLPGWL